MDGLKKQENHLGYK